MMTVENDSDIVNPRRTLWVMGNETNEFDMLASNNQLDKATACGGPGLSGLRSISTGKAGRNSDFGQLAVESMPHFSDAIFSISNTLMLGIIKESHHRLISTALAAWRMQI
jgi:hypothetical protein